VCARGLEKWLGVSQSIETTVRITHLSADFGVPVSGTKGASAHIRGLVQALRTEGHDVSVLAAAIGEDSPAPAFVREVPFNDALRVVHEELQQEDLCRGTRLSKDLRNLLYASNLELQGRLILQDVRPDFIYERQCLFGTAGLGLARHFQIPLILEVNAPLVLEHRQMRGLALPRVAAAAERLVLSNADHVVVVSEVLRAHVEQAGAAPDRVSVIPNAADPDMFSPAGPPCPIREQLGWKERFIVGFVGSMKGWHGVETLLLALAQLGGSTSPFRLLLVGSGPQLAEILDLRDRLGLAEAIHSAGSVPHDAVPGLLRAMDVGVAPYAAHAAAYFSPVKLFEYMAMGLPVVAARIGQAREIIDDGRTGWLYAPGDARELAGLIAHLERNRDLCRTVGAAARERVIQEHTWRLNAQKVTRIAADLITRRRVDAGTAPAIRHPKPAGGRANTRSLSVRTPAASGRSGARPSR
jgi:glycosyltransferase involved in cell wall biosynthesis